MYSIGLWDTRYPVATSHCLTPSHASLQVRRQRLARRYSSALGLEAKPVSGCQSQELLFYLSSHASEAEHQIGAINALLDQLSANER